MIFGFLSKFWIYIEKIHKKIKIFEIEKFSRKSRKNIFRDQKIFEKKSMKKSMKNENFKISIFSGKIFIDFFIEKNRKMFGLEKYFFDFFDIFFNLENIYFLMDFFLYRSEIFPRFQKSYLENRAVSLNIRKTKKLSFFVLNPGQRPPAARGWWILCVVLPPMQCIIAQQLIILMHC